VKTMHSLESVSILLFEIVNCGIWMIRLTRSSVLTPGVPKKYPDTIIVPQTNTKSKLASMETSEDGPGVGGPGEPSILIKIMEETFPDVSIKGTPRKSWNADEGGSSLESAGSGIWSWNGGPVET
jgi:hypothetical protein